MIIFFKTRSKARSFARKNPKYKTVDKGVNSSQRWGVRVA